MAAVRTSLVKRRHAWTGAKEPWAIDVEDEDVLALPERHRAGWRLFHYLSGGGTRAFAVTLAHDRVSRRQTRFLWISAGLAVLWLVFRYI